MMLRRLWLWLQWQKRWARRDRRTAETFGLTPAPGESPYQFQDRLVDEFRGLGRG
jgi:hypothetical protein